MMFGSHTISGSASEIGSNSSLSGAPGWPPARTWPTGSVKEILRRWRFTSNRSGSGPFPLPGHSLELAGMQN